MKMIPGTGNTVSKIKSTIGESNHRLNKADEKIHEILGQKKYTNWYMEKQILIENADMSIKDIWYTHVCNGSLGRKRKEKNREATFNKVVFQNWWKKPSHRFEIFYKPLQDIYR